MKYYSFINLPPLPIKLIKNAPLSTINPMGKRSNLNVKQVDGSEIPDAVYRRYELPENYTTWVKDNIPELKNETIVVGYQTIDNLEHRYSQLHPHTDGLGRGTYCINYIFELGGVDVKTSWWQEKNEEIVRTPWSHLFDLNKLIKLDEVVFSLKRWHIIRADILHSVQTLTSTRKAFTVGFNNFEIYEEIIKKYHEPL
jgi:hypothetical protein